MPKKILIDCDPGIDDAVALCLALFDPRVEVVGITATSGNIDAHQATSNVISLLDQLDPPKWPRVGAANVSDRVPEANARHIHGEDGLGDVGLVGTELHNQRPAEKVISDALRESPGDITILALGPLTNIARTLQKEQDLAQLIDQIVMVGGSINGIGNIRPCAEFNMFLRSGSSSVRFPLAIDEDTDSVGSHNRSGHDVGFRRAIAKQYHEGWQFDAKNHSSAISDVQTPSWPGSHPHS